jgi:cysteinyl-tRNA synthetase
MEFYNTLSRKAEKFKPLKAGEVGMYVCGPTVYGPAHIGHARTYIAFDFIRRYLEYRKFKVKFVCNITDIHDSMIDEANRQNITIFNLAEKNIKDFFKDMDGLGIKKADIYPRVTEHIKEIIELVKKLEKNGLAYETDDGVYFNVAKFNGYGKLSNIKIEKEKTGTRVETDKYEKESARDFALWKKEKPGEPSWESPWGKGRPGWHIECSAMSSKYLGEQIDIHGGAVDLIFPHHENEIAQSEGASKKKPFVKYWIHTGFLNVEGEKMSKSLGNYLEVKDLLAKHDAKVFRFFIAQSHYSSRIDFTKKDMANAAKTLERFNGFIQRLQEVKKGEENPFVDDLIKKYEEKIVFALDDNFKTPLMWSVLFEFEKEINKLFGEKGLSERNAEMVLDFLKRIDSIFQAFTFERDEVKLSAEQKKLVEQREKFRKEKKWQAADKIRDELLKQGLQLLDTPEGVKLKPI